MIPVGMWHVTTHLRLCKREIGGKRRTPNTETFERITGVTWILYLFPRDSQLNRAFLADVDYADRAVRSFKCQACHDREL